MSLICLNGHPAPTPTAWRCETCGAPYEIRNLAPFDHHAIEHGDFSLWRYRAMLPVEQRFTLGEGLTPLVESTFEGVRYRAKLDYLNPTGSYKDRGIATLINHLLAHGVTSIVADSSGNAGTAIALFGSGAGMQARVFVPANAPEGKKRAIAAGAEIIEVSGSRADVTDACIAALDDGKTVYASHAWSPYFIAGQMTAAWEIWEQMGKRAPSAVILPVGQGLFLLGVVRGFKALKDAGLIERLPRVFGVQSAACDPVVRGFEQGLDEPLPVIPEKTAADGIVIGNPVRGKQVMAAIRETGGTALRVEEADLLEARRKLAQHGLYVEPTSATSAAALKRVQDSVGSNAEIVVIYTGHGLKTPM